MSGKSKILAYQLDEETEHQLLDAVQAYNIDLFSKHLLSVEANYKSINSIKKIVQQLDKFQQIEWGKKLVKEVTVPHMVIGGYLLDRNSYYKKDPELIIKLVKEYCHHEDWNVRQSSVDLFLRMVAKTENNMAQQMSDFVHSDDPHYRRLALLTAKSIAKSASYELALKKKLLLIIEDILGEEDPYVQTVSSETFSEGYMKYCTEMTLNWLSEKLEDTSSIRVKSTVLNIVGSRYVDEHLENALTIIHQLLPEEDESIKKARSSALHTLSEVHHDRVSSFLESNLHIQQAVDHWAELEADGSLNSFDI